MFSSINFITYVSVEPHHTSPVPKSLQRHATTMVMKYFELHTSPYTYKE